MDGELGVDELPAADVERAGDTVPAVGDGEHPLQRAGFLVRQQRVTHPGPDRRGAGLGEVAVHRPPFDGRQVPVHPAFPGRRGRRLGGQRGRRRGPGRNRRAVRAQDPPGGGARHVAAASAGDRLQQLHAAAGTGQTGLHPDLADRDGAQDLAGEAGDDHFVAWLAPLDRPAQERARRAAMLGARIPRPGRIGGGQPRVLTGGDIEGAGHGWMLPGGWPGPGGPHVSPAVSWRGGGGRQADGSMMIFRPVRAAAAAIASGAPARPNRPVTSGSSSTWPPTASPIARG